MKILKKFKLFGHEIKVEINPDIIDKEDKIGLAIYREHLIQLADKLKHNIPDTMIEQTFFHELIHFIFEALQEEELRKNEKLVDNIANLLHQAFTTMEY